MGCPVSFPPARSAWGGTGAAGGGGRFLHYVGRVLTGGGDGLPGLPMVWESPTPLEYCWASK